MPGNSVRCMVLYSMREHYLKHSDTFILVLSRSRWACCNKGLSEVPRHASNSVRKSKANLAVVKLLHTSAASLASRDAIHLHDLNRFATSAVTTGHVVEQLGNSTSASRVAELLVHVMRSRSRIVAQKDAKVLHHLGRRIIALGAGQNLTIGTLQVLQTRRKVEKLALGLNVVLGKDRHAQQRGIRLREQQTNKQNE